MTTTPDPLVIRLHDAADRCRQRSDLADLAVLLDTAALRIDHDDATIQRLYAECPDR